MFMLILASSCVTSEQRKPHVMEKTTKISMLKLSSCRTSQCYVDLGLKEVEKITVQIDKDAANLVVAMNLLTLGSGEQAIDFALKIKNKRLRSRFNRQFSNMYVGMTIEAEDNFKRPSRYNLEPLNNLVGRVDEILLPYATFLAINDQIREAEILANSIREEADISRFYRALTIVHVNHNRLDEALNTAERIVFKGSKDSRDLVISNFVGRLYLAGRKEQSLNLLKSFNSKGAINIGHRNVAIAMATLGEIDEAIALNEKLKVERIRAHNLVEMSKELAKLGEIEGIHKILQSNDGDAIQPIGFGQIIATLLEYNHAARAKELIEEEQSSSRLIRAFAEIGATNKDQSYFQRANDLYVKSDDANSDNISKKIASTGIPILYEKSHAYAIASAMARAGLLDYSIEFLHQNVSETEIIGMRNALFYELTEERNIQPEISDIDNTMQLDFSQTKPEYVSHLIKQYLSLIKIKKVPIDFLNRIIKYSESILKLAEKEAILARMVPLYAAAGKKTKAHELIAGLENSLSRINAIFALATLCTSPEKIVYSR
tara:strand:+ start:737 stop:2374 length:1638 start_codon:yes stop_codon:yes gene_type:complete